MSNPQMNPSERNTVRPLGPVNSPSVGLTEVVVHINEDLGEERRDTFEQALRAMRGILDLTFCRNRHHLLIVQYQLELVSSATLIEQVRRLAGDAQLIGPI